MASLEYVILCLKTKQKFLHPDLTPDPSKRKEKKEKRRKIRVETHWSQGQQSATASLNGGFLGFRKLLVTGLRIWIVSCASGLTPHRPSDKMVPRALEGLQSLGSRPALCWLGLTAFVCIATQAQLHQVKHVGLFCFE